MSEGMIVHTDDKELSLVIEYQGRKYRYNSTIHDTDELEYLAVRVNGFQRSGSVESYLAQEFDLLY